jgi:N4-gp56 family major capsid protein
MSVTRKADVTDQIPSIWAKDLYAQAEKLTFWHRFEGPEGSSMPLIRRDDLEKQPGDTVKLDIVLALTGAGLTGSTSNGLLDGNEEKMHFRQMSFTVDALRHGVRWEKLGKILINHSMRSTALMQLRKWLAGKLDDDIFTTLSAVPAAGGGTPYKNVLVVNTTTTLDAGTASINADDVEAANVLTLDLITAAKAYAKVELQMEPVRMENGEELYFLVAHDYVIAELKKTTAWQTAQRDARERGAGNPLFTGAVGMWDNVVILSSDRINRAANATSVQVATNLLLGAQAVARGYAYYPDWTEQYFSYGEEQGIGTYTVFGSARVQFDLNATETANDATDDTAIGFCQILSEAPAQV